MLRSMFAQILKVCLFLARGLAMIVPTLLAVVSSSSAMVGGEAVAPDSPFARSTVLILFGQQNRCTGVIVHPRLVLTAGHCGNAPVGGYVIAYTTDLTPALQRREKVTTGKVLAIRQHPRAHEVDALSDDLALFILAEPLPPTYGPAALPAFALSPLLDQTVTSLGFGLQNAEGILRSMVPGASERDVWEPVSLTRKDFLVTHPEDSEFHGIQLNYDRLFVEQPDGGICQGDSGGPVFLKTEGDAPVLVAVNGATVPNFGAGPARPTCAANAYVTRVDTSLPWIRAVAAEVSAMSGK